MKTAIYKITNCINNKSYIGQTVNPDLRWWQHRNGRGSVLLSQALKKYGEENFLFEILEWTENPDERERYLIEKFNSMEKGYNLTLGGIGGKTIKKEKIDEIYDLLLNTDFTIKEISEKTKIGITTISFINNGHTFVRKEYIYPIRKPSNARRSFYLTKEEVIELEEALINYQSLMKVSKIYNVDRGSTLGKINKGKHSFSSKDLKFPLVRPRKATREEVKEIEFFLENNLTLSYVEVGLYFNREKELIGKINNGEHQYSERIKYPIR